MLHTIRSLPTSFMFTPELTFNCRPLAMLIRKQRPRGLKFVSFYSAGESDWGDQTPPSTHS